MEGGGYADTPRRDQTNQSLREAFWRRLYWPHDFASERFRNQANYCGRRHRKSKKRAGDRFPHRPKPVVVPRQSHNSKAATKLPKSRLSSDRSVYHGCRFAARNMIGAASRACTKDGQRGRKGDALTGVLIGDAVQAASCCKLLRQHPTSTQ